MLFRLICTVSFILVLSTNGTVSAKDEFSVDRELAYCRAQVKKALKELRPYNFDMQPRTVIANAKVKDDLGRMAFERGPLVYCAEGIDNPNANVHNIFIGETPKISVSDHTIKNTEGDNRPFTVKSLVVDNVQVMTTSDSGRLTVMDTSLRLIPYYSWNHRGAGLMDVWFASSLEAFK